MFILTNTDLPDSITTFSNSFINSVLKPVTTLTNSGVISKLFNDVVTTITNVTVGSISDTYEVEVDSLPSVIITTDRIFTLAIDTPVDGEFIYVNNTVVIYSSLPLTTVTILNTPIVKSLKIPQISGLGNLPILSTISISESFQDHPSASINLVTSTNYIAQVRSVFKLSSLFKLDKYEFVVNSYNEEISNNDDILRVSISLRGKWDNYVNYAIPLNPAVNTALNYGDPECAVNSTNTSTSKRYLTINEIASKIGARVTGITFTTIVDKADVNATVSIASLLSNYVDINSSFIDYTNPSYILVRKLNNVRSWSYNDSNILSNFNTTVNRTLPLATNSSYSTLNQPINYAALVPSTITNKLYTLTNEDISIIPYPTIYNSVTSDVFDDSGNIEPDEATKDIQSTFELRKPVKREYYKGDLDAAICPPNITRLTTLDLNHDNSGVTKTVTYVIEEDNNPISEVTRRYGFAYTAWDITLISGDDIELNGNAVNSWTLIEETTTNYIYDEETGYLLGYELNGRKLIRAAIEGTDNYTQLYNLALNEGETPSSFDTATYNTYLFRYVAVAGAKAYKLAQHRDYYEQFGQQAKFIKRCNKDGSSSYIADPTYVEPMFAIAESEQYSCFLRVDNPANIDRDPTDPIQPNLTSGQETYNRTILQILPSKNSNRDTIFGFDSAFKGEDSYITYTSNFTAQDPAFRAVTEETSDSTNSGIPPVHTRKPPKYELVEPKKEETKTTTNYKYVFWTAPYTGGYPRTTSTSFDKAKNITEFKRGVVNQLRIDDIRNTLTSTMTIPYNRDISTGDKVTVIVNGLQCYRRVISINHSIDQQYTNEGIITTATTNLTMGIDRAITVSSKREKVVKPINPTKNLIFDVIDVGFTLGSLLPNTLGRGS